MALLRAEIIDLEDKYYALKSEYERGGIDGGNVIVTDGVVGSGVMGSPAIVTQYPAADGEIIYSDEYIEPTLGNEVYYQGQPSEPTLAPRSIQTAPNSDSIELPLELSPDSETVPAPIEANPPSIQQSQTQLRLPASDLNAGFENIEGMLQEVDRIEILSQGTRGKDVDGIPGDEGIELMITTVDGNQNYIEATGELTVTVRDPSLGEIGKWTFLPEELELFFSRDEFDNRGLLLHLPWTGQLPVSTNIDIRVKMLLNGIEYIATRNLKISPPEAAAPNDAIAGWTANDNRWLSNTRQPMLQASTIGRMKSSSTKKPAQTVERPKWRPVR